MTHDFQFLELQRADAVLTIALNRPPHNILHVALLDELGRALDMAAENGAARMLLLTGTGERFFSAGVDVADHTPARVAEMLRRFHCVVRQLRDCPVPTVAALNGSALGGGLELALACDLLVAVEDARLGQPEIRLGVFAPVAASLLPRLLPPARANELLLGGAPLPAEEACRYGLLNRVFARARFAEDCQAFLQPYLALSGAALRLTKQATRLAAGKPFDEALAQLERLYLDELMRTHDAQEGIAAFLDRRAPQWRHR